MFSEDGKKHFDEMFSEFKKSLPLEADKYPKTVEREFLMQVLCGLSFHKPGMGKEKIVAIRDRIRAMDCSGEEDAILLLNGIIKDKDYDIVLKRHGYGDATSWEAKVDIVGSSNIEYDVARLVGYSNDSPERAIQDLKRKIAAIKQS